MSSNLKGQHFLNVEFQALVLNYFKKMYFDTNKITSVKITPTTSLICRLKNKKKPEIHSCNISMSVSITQYGSMNIE